MYTKVHTHKNKIQHHNASDSVLLLYSTELTVLESKQNKINAHPLNDSTQQRIDGYGMGTTIMDAQLSHNIISPN